MIDAGIVGLGWWANRLIESVQGKSDRIRLVHGVALDPATKQEIARRHALVLSPSLAAMLGDPAVQAVVLATPHSLHRAEIEAVAAAGKLGEVLHFKGMARVAESERAGSVNINHRDQLPTSRPVEAGIPRCRHS
jgi:predicted dehydrogenase